MTANTKMTETRAKQIYGDAVKERVTSWHGVVSGSEWQYASGFLEGLQAGRAEMAEENQRYRLALERISQGENHRVPNVNGGTDRREGCREWDVCNCEQVEAKEALSQRAGGKK